MLGKLIKYDLKYGARIFIIIHAIIFAASVLGRFLFLERLDFSADANRLIAPITLFITLYLLLFISLNIGVSILVAARFYKNLFTSEGYLTWTLPASPLQHLWSKIISGTIWLVLNILITALSVIILVTGDNSTAAYARIASDFTESFGMTVSQYGLYMLLFSLFCSLGCVIMFYVCIVIGQLFPGHRLLCAVIAYFIITFIIEVLAFAVMFAMGLFPATKDFIANTGGNAANYLFAAFKCTAVLTIFTTILEYGAMHYIMNKKIDLT